jgi:hypothetical protein
VAGLTHGFHAITGRLTALRFNEESVGLQEAFGGHFCMQLGESSRLANGQLVGEYSIASSGVSIRFPS